MDYIGCYPACLPFLRVSCPIAQIFQQLPCEQLSRCRQCTRIPRQTTIPGCISTYRAIKCSSSATAWMTEVPRQQGWHFKKLGWTKQREQKLHTKMCSFIHQDVQRTYLNFLLTTKEYVCLAWHIVSSDIPIY